ncbi:MAG: trigger factor [Alphaproteobacteria bacterium]
MKISEVKKTATEAQYSVVVPAKTISTKISEKLADYADKADIPGFRKGKAPAAVLEKRFGDNAFGDVINTEVQTAVEKVANDNSLRVAMQPNVELKTADKEKDLEFSVSYVLMPEIKLMDFAKVKVEQIKAKISAKEVDEAVNNIAKDYRDSKKVDRAAKNGDVTVIDFLGKLDGTPFDGGAGNDHSLELGSNSFIPGFEEQLVGSKAGDKKDVVVTFPTEYHADNLAGKEAVFECTVKEVKEYVDTKVDDEFATKLGLKDLAELKENIKGRLSSQFDPQTRTMMKKEIMDQLDAGHKIDAPEVMVEQEFSEIFGQFKQMKEQGQLPEDEAKKSDKEAEKEYKELAVRRVKLGLLLTEIATANKIEVSQDDVNQAVMAEAQRYPGQEMQVFEFYQKNPQVLEQLKAPILEEKVIDAILEKADVKVKEMDVKDIEKLLNADAPKPAKKAKAKKAAAKKS